MSPISTLLALAGLTVLLGTLPAAAEDAELDTVPFLTGGVGEQEREALQAAAEDYNLKLVFARADGAFVADVQVTVTDSEGSTLLDVTSEGPLLFAKLPPGSYTVKATYRGDTKESTASVGETGRRTLDFRWSE